MPCSNIESKRGNYCRSSEIKKGRKGAVFDLFFFFFEGFLTAGYSSGWKNGGDFSNENGELYLVGCKKAPSTCACKRFFVLQEDTMRS